MQKISVCTKIIETDSIKLMFDFICNRVFRKADVEIISIEYIRERN